MNDLVIAVLFTMTGLLTTSAHAAAVQTTRHGLSITPTLGIHYSNGRVSGQIHQWPLGEVLRQIALETGARYHVLDSEISKELISADIRDMPLDQGVRKLLEGFSYALYSNAKGGPPWILVLGTPPKIPRAKVDGAAAPSPGTGPDETQRVDAAASSATVAQQDPAVAEQQARLEAELVQILDAAQSGDDARRLQAVNQLVGIEDPRATQVLIEAATDAKLRRQAVGALWRHAADLQFADSASVDALRHFAQDSDNDVSSIARQALSDMGQYQAANATQD